MPHFSIVWGKVIHRGKILVKFRCTLAQWSSESYTPQWQATELRGTGQAERCLPLHSLSFSAEVRRKVGIGILSHDWVWGRMKDSCQTSGSQRFPKLRIPALSYPMVWGEMKDSRLVRSRQLYGFYRHTSPGSSRLRGRLQDICRLECSALGIAVAKFVLHGLRQLWSRLKDVCYLPSFAGNAYQLSIRVYSAMGQVERHLPAPWYRAVCSGCASSAYVASPTG